MKQKKRLVNVKSVEEKMKKLQKRLREYERLYYIELGKMVEQCLINGSDIEVVKQKASEIRKAFGKE